MNTLEQGSKYDIQYRQAVLEEMADGLLIDIATICKECAKYIQNQPKKKRNDSDRPNIPPHALIRGLFPGVIPKELHGLTAVELSMISIYSNTTKIALNCQGHFHGKPTFYTIVNEDLVDVCEILPRIPSHNEFAILRHRGADFIHDFKYRPAKVLSALNWLRKNNHLYHPEKIGVDESLLDLSSSNIYLEQPYFEIDDEEAEAMQFDEARSMPSTNAGKEFPVCDHNNEMIIVIVVVVVVVVVVVFDILILQGSRGEENSEEVLLHFSERSTTLSEALVKATLDDEPSTSIKRENEVPVFERSQRHTFKYTKNFEDVYERDHEDYFWEKCYPHLFPYGRGGPSDRRYSTVRMNISTFFKRMLERGGHSKGLKYGRRFQNSPSFIFAAYVMDSRSRIASVSVLAAKAANSSTAEADETITVGDVKSIIKDAALDILTQDPDGDKELLRTSSEAVNIRLSVKKLIDRLVPFSQELRGSPIYFALERKKLLSMLTNPVVTTVGAWSWFASFAAPEVYECTLYEVAEDAYISPRDTSAVKSYVRCLTKSQRLTILKESPALSARLFHLKQEAFWNTVLMGKSEPLGPIGDWWRRVEVRYISIELIRLFN